MSFVLVPTKERTYNFRPVERTVGVFLKHLLKNQRCAQKRLAAEVRKEGCFFDKNFVLTLFEIFGKVAVANTANALAKCMEISAATYIQSIVRMWRVLKKKQPARLSRKRKRKTITQAFEEGFKRGRELTEIECKEKYEMGVKDGKKSVKFLEDAMTVMKSTLKLCILCVHPDKTLDQEKLTTKMVCLLSKVNEVTVNLSASLQQ